MNTIKKLFKNPFFNICLILLIGVLVVYISFSNQDPKVLLKTIKEANLGYILLAVFLVFLWQYFVGIHLSVLTKTKYPKYNSFKGFVNAIIAALFHGITPSATGGQIIQMYVFKKQKVSTSDAGSILWMDFIIYQTALTLLSFILIALKFPFFVSHFSGIFYLVIIGFIINAAFIFMIYALAKFKKLHEFITTKGIDFAYKFHFIKDKEEVNKKIEISLERFREENKNLGKNTKVIILCMILCMLRLLIYYAIPFVIFMAFGTPFNLDLFINSIAMGAFVAIVSGLIPIPGASGGTEAIFILMFGNLFGDIATTSAMLIWRFLTYYFVMFIGAIALGILKLKER